MSKVAIITDSTAYIPSDVREKHDIQMIPLNVIFKNESFKEEIDISTDAFYKRVRESGELPTTSQPAIGLIVEELEKLSDTYDEAVMITLSSEISGTYQSAVSAAEMVDSIELHVFDSEISCMLQGFYVLEAAKLAKQGANATEIVQRLTALHAGVDAYFMVDDLNNLHRGGRLNAAQLVVGNLLQVKPVLRFENKRIVPYEKVRTRKKAIKRILELLDENVRDAKKVSITVIHANREEEAQQLTSQIREKYPQAELVISYFGPVIGTHLGEGSIGIGWMKYE